MPKLKFSLPSYRHHKVSGHAIVTLSGKDHYLGPWQSESSKTEYKRLLAEWIAAGKTTTATEIESRVGITVAELLTAYLAEAEVAYTKNGQTTSHLHNIKDALIPLRDLYAKEPVATFGPLKLKAVRETVVKRGLCRSTINKHVGTIKRIFKWGTENELVPATVFHALQAVSGLRRGRSAAKESVPVKPVPEIYVKAALLHVSVQVAAMVRLQQLTGMRPGEVTIMRGCDLDMSGKVWTYTPSILLIKDRRREMIPIDKIKVINSRTRDETQFAMNVQSIGAIGQIKDIRVNDKFLTKDGHFELICGEGRLIAQKRLGKTQIRAEIVTCTRKLTWSRWWRIWRAAGPARWSLRAS